MCLEASGHLKNQSVTSGERTLSLSDWLVAATHFNSDPRHSGDRRFEGFTQEFAHHFFGGEQPGFISKHENLFFDGNQTLYQLNGAVKTPWVMTSGEQMLDLDSRDGWIWTKSAELVIARHSADGRAYEFALSSSAMLAYAFGSNLLVSDENGVYLLKVSSAGIEQANHVPHAGFSRVDNGLAILSQESSAALVDLSTGSIVALPEQPIVTLALRRVDDHHLIRYVSPSLNRPVCKLIGADGSVADLTSSGDCINYAPENQVGIFNVGGRAIRREFRDGALLREEDVGGLGEYYSDGLVKTTHNGRFRYFCFGANRIEEIAKPSNVLDITACNENYLIEAIDMRNWRVRLRNSGEVVLRSEGYMGFASEYSGEHFVVTSANNMTTDEVFGLIDLKRPERFSILTGVPIWRDWGAHQDRFSGLVVQKTGQAVWLFAEKIKPMLSFR